VSGSAVVLVVSLLTWALLFVYLMRLDRRIKGLEKR
jgi:CcmD family protein